jgi:predicted MFS family arabinose efflux permease
MNSTSTPFPRALLYLLALGTFAIGTESFMIAGLLPRIAGDLQVSVAQAGLLVTAFALSYAVGGPLIAIATSGARRRTVLVGGMALFAVGNALAWASHNYGGLLAARILLALTAGLYTPSANALASAIAPPAQRGRALAIVSGGMTVAIVFGVPLGTLLGNHFGWRATFAAVALLSAGAALALALRLPASLGDGAPAASLRARLAAARLPGVLPALLVTMLWGTGAYSVLTYLAPYLKQVAGMPGEQMSLVLLMWGLAAAAGLAVGGRANDRLGSLKVVVPSLALLGGAFYYLAIMGRSGHWPLAALLPAIALWGFTVWSFYPAQMSSLVERSGVALAPVVLSLNASFQYAGFSFGALLGGVAVARLSPGQVGWVGGSCELLALGLTLLMARRRAGATAAAAC